MKSLNKNIFLISIACISLYSCTEKMPLDLGSTYTRLIVDGIITSDTTSHYVRLAKSADYFYNKQLEPISNAIVKISSGDDTIMLTESSEKPGWYYTSSDFYGIAGNEYHLTINNVDIDGNHMPETYTASCMLRPVAKPDSIKITASNNSFVDYNIKYYGQEPANSKDFYLFKCRRNGKMLTDTLTETYPSDDEFYNGLNLKNITVYNLFKSKKDEDIQPGDTITLEISNITKEYNQFLIDLQFESHGSDPFGGQPANLSTNISDSKRAMGFFAAYSIKRASYIVKKEDLEKK
jgi:hypothetical protein